MKILVIAANLLFSPDGSEILLIHRTKAPYANHYALIGGKTEFGESLFESLQRETKEETGISIKRGRLFAILNEIFYSGEKQIAHFLIHYWVSFSKDKSVIPTKEGTLHWASLDDLPKPIVPSDELVIKEYLENPHILSYYEGAIVEKKDGSLMLQKWEKIK